MSNRHRGTDSDRAMRNRQISEALGEDARASEKAFLLNFPFVQQNKEDFLRPDELDRKTQFELSGMIDKMASSLSQAVSALAIPAEAGKLTQGISEFLSAFNRAAAYVRLYGRTGKLSNREEQAIQEKFDAVIPSLEQILNAHAAGNPIPEFRAVLNAYDNIMNNDLRPVDFSPPLDIPQPQQAGQPAQPNIPFVGPQAQRGPPQQQQQQQQPPAQQAQGPPQPNPLLIIPEAILNNPNINVAMGWLAQNRGVAPQELQDRFAAAQTPAQRGRVLGQFVRLQRAFLDTYNRELAAYNAAQGQAPAPVGQPAGPPVAPQQPPDVGDRRRAATDRLNNRIISTLEGNRQALLAAQQALAANPQLPRAQRQDPRQLQDAVNRAVDGVRLYERRAITAGIPANTQYDPNIHGPAVARLDGRGMYGGVSADMAGMDEEYLDLKLHDGFIERGNWTGMMRALQQMPTHPYGAGIEAEEGEEMPVASSTGSSHRVGFYDDPDLVSDDEEPEEEMEDDDMYDREMAGRGQLDDVAERIQANRQKSELNVAKGGAKNMKDMLAKLKSKIRC
jgi:AraC-like DNA-binding protein